MAISNTATEYFRSARDLLLDLRDDPEEACARFRWPRMEEFNWALDWLDRVGRHNHQPALRIVRRGQDRTVSYHELAEQSDRVASWLRAMGVRRQDRLLVMLDNQEAVWETLLAIMKLGAVIIPTFATISPGELTTRLARASVRHVITSQEFTDAFAAAPPHITRICVGGRTPGWLCYDDAYAGAAAFTPDAPTRGDDLLALYFTSGTTSRPKLVQHTHASYPVGHLSSMYWNGLRPGDSHLNVSAPGWAKHAWSSFFAPLSAEATVVSVSTERGSAEELLDVIAQHGVSTFCAPPTVWRMLIQQNLARWPVRLREASSVGEPLSPAIVDKVQAAWGIPVRDGYGQTETTAQIGTSPGLAVKPGSMGKSLPGYEIALLDPGTGRPASEGEICVSLAERPAGMMPGYLDDPEKNAEVFAGGYYHTGDIGYRDADGYISYIGRRDDVFKSYDYRISPFELESVLLRHAAVTEAAVVPSPDPMGLVVPKAYVTVSAGCGSSAETARSIIAYAQENLARHQWIRRIEFASLPKTTSGKIRRKELRELEIERADRDSPAAGEYFAEDLLSSAGPSAPGLDGPDLDRRGVD